MDAITKSTVKINRHTDVIKRKVVLCGTKDVMFDRYAGDNDTKLEPHQKLYLAPGSGSPVIGIPAANIMSFLSAHNTNDSTNCCDEFRSLHVRPQDDAGGRIPACAAGWQQERLGRTRD
jgi:hypothetical protein